MRRSSEKTYLHWNRRFLAYCHESGTGSEPTAANAKAFLTHLAMVEKVSASHSGFGSTLFLRDFYWCPIVKFCEWFHRWPGSR